MGNDYQDVLAAQQADEDRTKRLFIGFLSSALGVDQTMHGEDSVPSRGTGDYIIANPDGSYSALGQPVSNLNRAPAQTVQGLPVGLLMLAGLAYMLFK